MLLSQTGQLDGTASFTSVRLRGLAGDSYNVNYSSVTAYRSLVVLDTVRLVTPHWFPRGCWVVPGARVRLGIETLHKLHQNAAEALHVGPDPTHLSMMDPYSSVRVITIVLDVWQTSKSPPRTTLQQVVEPAVVCKAAQHSFLSGAGERAHSHIFTCFFSWSHKAHLPICFYGCVGARGPIYNITAGISRQLLSTCIQLHVKS